MVHVTLGCAKGMSGSNWDFSEEVHSGKLSIGGIKTLGAVVVSAMELKSVLL